MPNIVKHPGGVILHLEDGSAEYFAYGTDVDPSRLADYQRDTLKDHTDSKDRSAYRRETPAVEQEAHRNAAFADGGQVNSTSDPVPGNYGELSEEDAAQLVMSLSNDPQIQARLLLHERVHHGSRQMVIDAGSGLATAIAETLYSHVADGGRTDFANTPIVDRERQLERQSRGQASGGGDGDGLSSLKRADLDKRAKAAGVEDPDALPNKEAVIEAIQQAESGTQSSSSGSTPSPNS